MPRSFRDYVEDYLRNWRESEEPFLRKVSLALRNRRISIVTLKGCCGHPGEPGC